MAEKLKSDLSLVLPDIPDERDACVGRLTPILMTALAACLALVQHSRYVSSNFY